MSTHHHAHSHRHTLAQPANCPLNPQTLSHILSYKAHTSIHNIHTISSTPTPLVVTHTTTHLIPAPTWTHNVYTTVTYTLTHTNSHCHTHLFTHTVTHTLTASYKDGTCILHPPLPKLTTGHTHQSKLLIHVLIYSSQYLLMTVSSMNLYHLLFMLIPLFIILGISGTHGDVSAEGSRSVVCLGPACVPQCLLSSQHRCPVNTGEGMQGPEMVGRPADQT